LNYFTDEKVEYRAWVTQLGIGLERKIYVDGSEMCGTV